ncbi:MAG: 30S ribosome-binding factor RbfA [Bacteroidetes bacterium]|nr:30S ribosome-binding factor RbfA [Bacteroidota bacterium]
MSIRTERVASLIREELGTMLSREFSGSMEFGFTTVTETRVTPDLRTARVFVSIMGSAAKVEKTMAQIEKKKAYYRSELAERINLKFAPAIEFRLDKSLDNAMHIEELIKQIHKDDPKQPKDE